MTRTTLRRTLVPAAMVATALAVVAPPALAADSLTPSSVELTLAPGQSAHVAKKLHLDAAPPQADIELAIDTTGSMSDTINQAKADATNLVSAVQAQIPGARFSVVAFRDSGDGAQEYRLVQPMTGSGAAIQTAVNGLSAGGGGDAPEAHNLVFDRSVTDAGIGFRPTARKFVVVLSDAEPHGAGTFAALQPGCRDTTADPHGLSTAGELASMKAAERTLFMVRQVGGATSTSLACYKQLAALAFTGGDAVDGGNSLGTQIVGLIQSAVQTINRIDLATEPASFASWATFAPTSPFGPVTAPFDKTFDETIQVPASTPGGDYAFDVVATADGAKRATEHVVVHVPAIKISVDDVTVTEGDVGTTPAKFTVSLDKPATGPVSVHYQTVDGTATAPADYAAASGTLTFAAGEQSKAVTVAVAGDRIDEPNETYHLHLSAPVGATFADDDGLGKILDDDRSGTFSCRGSGIRLLGLEIGVSNSPFTPCRDEAKSLLSLPLGGGTVTVGAQVLGSSTNQTPDDLSSAQPATGDRGESDANAATVTLLAGGSLVKATAVTSHAEARCGAPAGSAPVLAGSSRIVGLTVDGRPVAVGTGEIRVNLLLGVLHVNSTQKTATGVTQRGIWFENRLLGSALDVVVAEARAGYTGNPCV